MSEPRDRHIRRSGDDYAGALASLLPQGFAWPRLADSTLMKSVRGLAQIFGYVDSRAADMLEIETDPRITQEMLPDWERNWGLPDPCFPTVGDFDQRHKTLMLKMTIEGGQSREFFYHVADLFGYSISIHEFSPYMCGIGQFGDVRGEDNRQRWHLAEPEIRFYWTVNIAGTSLYWQRCGVAQCGIDPHLRIETAGDLQCIFNRWKPAHTLIVFDFTGVDYSNWYSFEKLYPGEEKPIEPIEVPEGFIPVEGHGAAIALGITVTPIIGRAMLNNGLPNALGVSAGGPIIATPSVVSCAGPLAATEFGDVMAIAGRVVPVGSFNLFEPSDAASISGLVGRIGTLAAPGAPDTCAMSGA